MKNYKEVYEYHEENNKIHTDIAEVEQAEQELKTIITAIVENQWEIKDALDTAIGKIARAYEMQGFVFANNLVMEQEARI